MDVKRLEKRNVSLDIVRIFAVFMVNSVHFFLYNGYYSEPVKGMPMFIMTIMRTLFTVCVPLFMILTGWLMSQKTLSKGYYKGLRKTLIVYLIATVACMLFKTFETGDEFNPAKLLLDTLSFKGATYSWYIEFYIGLFLIAPFLNLMYNGLKTQRQKQVLVFTFFAISMLPNIFNMHRVADPAWWANPVSNTTEYDKLLPSWWTMIYPVAYYFVGAYLREFGMKVKNRTLLIGYGVVLLMFSAFNFYRNYGGTFNYGTILNWGTFEAYVLTCGAFVLLTRIPTGKLGTKSRWCLWKLSDLALGIYLFSYIFDYLIYYKFLNVEVTVMTDRAPWYLFTVPVVFICSAVASYLANKIAKGIIYLYEKIRDYAKKEIAAQNGAKWLNILFFTLLGGGIIFALWKCFYGFGGYDEGYYISLANRFVKGDALYFDEWHLAQTSGVLTMPFVWLYTTIAGSADGIVLAARIFYVFVHAGVCSVVYWRLRKYGIFSVLSLILFFIYTPYDIMALSYNTMGLGLVVLSGVLIATADYKKKAALIVSGLCFAGAVLCNPYMVLVYALYVVLVIVHQIIKKREGKNVLHSEMFSLKTLLWVTVGAVILAVPFLILLLSRTSIAQIIETLPKMMNDPEHTYVDPFYRFTRYFTYIWSAHDWMWIGIVSWFGIMLTLILDRKRRVHRSWYLIGSLAVALYTFMLILPKLLENQYNTVMFPAIFVGIPAYILLKDKPRELFAGVFVLGVLYSFAMLYSSNQYIYIVTMALSAANVASYVFVGLLLREIRETEDELTYAPLLKYSAIVLSVILVFMQGGFEIYVKANHCFWESSPSELVETIEEGPAKGLLTTAANHQAYKTIYDDLQYYKQKTPDKILMFTDKTWLYLELPEYEYATYSAYFGAENLNPIEKVIERLKTYYIANPEKLPKYVYMPKATTWDVNAVYAYFGSLGYTFEDAAGGYRFEKK